MEIRNLLDMLEKQIGNPSAGLPRDMFFFVSRLTPLVNVDLLLKNPENGTLLTWRDDEFYGPGWHVPGGIVRFRETMAARVAAVAADELGARVEFGSEPLAVNEIMSARGNTRGHFISLLYECRLASSPDPAREYKGGAAKNGEWAWHAKCPENLIPGHGIYKDIIDGILPPSSMKKEGEP